MMILAIAHRSYFAHPIVLAFDSEACHVGYVWTWQNLRQVGGIRILRLLCGRLSCVARSTHWRASPIRLWILDACSFTSRHRLGVCLLQLDRSRWLKHVPTILRGKVGHHNIIPSVSHFFAVQGRDMIFKRLCLQCWLPVVIRKVV